MNLRIFRIAVVLLLLSIIPVSLLLTGAALPSCYSETYYAELSDMYDRLYTAEGKKIVIVGGSSVAFGLDTALMEQLLSEYGYNYTVCSFGLYAAVGTSAMLDLSEDALKEGDIVILAMEPTSETMSGYFGATAFWKCAEDTPQMLLHLDRNKQAALFGNYVPYLQERWDIHRDGTVPVSEDVYAKSSFNDRCDMIYHRAGNSMALGFDTGSPIDLASVTIAGDFAKQLNDYCFAASQRGVTVVMSFGPMNVSAMTDSSPETVGAFFTLCNDTLVCPIISDPNDYILEGGWFYDSNFHLNTAGAEIRTVALTSDILAYLGCYHPLEYTLPDMPDSIAQIEISETESRHFEFTPIAGGSGYFVCGLTESGLKQTTLTVPAAYEGTPVVGFTDDALEQATKLEELRLPQSIECIPDYLFQYCNKLTRLILEHRVNPCAIGEHPFSGASQIRIYVPEESLSLYRDGAGCETNLWAKYLDIIFPYP